MSSIPILGFTRSFPASRMPLFFFFLPDMSTTIEPEAFLVYVFFSVSPANHVPELSDTDSRVRWTLGMISDW